MTLETEGDVVLHESLNIGRGGEAVLHEQGRFEDEGQPAPS